MSAEFDPSQFETSGINFIDVEKSFIDERLLAILHSESARHQKKGISPSEIAGSRTRNGAYSEYRCRIMAFSDEVYPSVVTHDLRSKHLASGMIYADRLITLGWLRRHESAYKTRALRFAVAEQINLEGPLATASDTLASLQAHVDERYVSPGSQYWDMVPEYGCDDDDKSAFMLGAGLVCHEAGLVLIGRYDGSEHDRAISQINSAIAHLA